MGLPVALDQGDSPLVWETPTPAQFFIPTAIPQDTPTVVAAATEEPPPILIAPTVPTPDPANSWILYRTQAGDTIEALTVRFDVMTEDITSPTDPVPLRGFINPDQLLIIPNRLGATSSNERLMPDSELVNSPSAADFDVRGFVESAGGFLNGYEEYLGSTGQTSGAEVIQRVAIENSINPRFLLALLEYESGWVFGQPDNLVKTKYPLGFIDKRREELYRQLVWAVNHLSVGYYGWREGFLTDLKFVDGTTARLAPDLNAGTVALQYYFAQKYDASNWLKALDPETGFPALHAQMFGNPWVRALSVEPLFPPDLAQPSLILPFMRGQLWSYTGGPHGAWERDGSQAALDFAPGSVESGCVKSTNMVLAAASGLVTRAEHGIVMIDLDGDGLEQTGWGLLYLHITTNGNRHPAPVGTWVEKGDFIGYPSCEGGLATGTHIHVARKYNGEWIAADGPIPFIIGEWLAHAGNKPYEGTLTRGGETVTASPLGTFFTRIMRGVDDP
jgi:murein DD-endopeptidase MepM/ murein hydrolase activator NlpD